MWLVEEGFVSWGGQSSAQGTPALISLSHPGAGVPSSLEAQVWASAHNPQQGRSPGSCGGWGKRGTHSSPFLSSWGMSGSTTPAPALSSCHPIACPHLDPSILHTLLCPHSVSPDSQGWGSRTSVFAQSSFSPPLRPPPPWSGSESKGMFWSLGRMGAPQRREEGEEATPSCQYLSPK